MNQKELKETLSKFKNIEESSMPINLILGKKIELKIPNGEVRSGQFAIAELNLLKPSHNHLTFKSTEGYPLDSKGDNVNDRNYNADVNAQQKVREFAQNLEADRLISTSRTPSGTPIIIANGVVVSGNNRTMSLKLASKEHPEKFDEYLNFLSEELGAFGFTEDQQTEIFKLHLPVLVRLDYDIPALNTLELSKYNKETKKSERPIDKAVKLGKMLQENSKCKEVIGEIVGKYETFSEFYADRNAQKTLLDTLISCNILTDLERPLYFGESGFTTNGKDLIENLLVGLVLSKEALLDVNENVKKYRGMLITSLPVLSMNSTIEGFSIIDELNDALILEAKIVNSKLEFKDWILQHNMFEEKPNKNTLFFNRFLSIGRNKFKQSIEKFNTSAKDNTGNMLFGESATKQEVFDKFIVEQLNPEDIVLINSIFNQPQIKNEDKLDTTENKEVKIKLSITTEKAIKNLFADGNYFKENPSKILAIQEDGISRYKKPITLYKGTVDNVDRIDVDFDVLALSKDDNPILSNFRTPIKEMIGGSISETVNLEKALSQSKKDIRKKSARLLKQDKPFVTATSANDKLETFTLQEMFELYNPGISNEEVKAFLWHQKNIGKPVLNNEWYELVGLKSLDDLPIGNEDPEVLKWAKNGTVFYDRKAGGFVPGYIYLSGNVYDKYNRINKSELSSNVGSDADFIIELIGKEAFDNQVQQMKMLFQRKYAERLIISETDENSVSILPTSIFARDFYIKSLADEAPFKWKTITAASNKRYGQVDFLADVYASGKKEIAELSLKDAFSLWLVSDKTISIKQGITYADIINYYILAKPKPRTAATRDANGDYSANDKKIMADENAIFARLKSKSKNEGDRLFNQFLDTQLSLNDRIRVETTWNEQFNNNVTLESNKVPVAFRMNKFCAGQPNDLRPEKREAVAFTMSNGSALLAYDVGVGKTPSAIFTVSSFIDLGWAKRPLIIVPNQTYKQWINEFKNFAGHLPLNKMYNLNDSTIEEFQDTHGNTISVPEGTVTIMTYEGMLKLGFTEQTQEKMHSELVQIIAQDTEGLTDKRAQARALSENTTVAELIGKVLSRTKANFEDFGFDYVCLDEAHACKKVFTNVAGKTEENTGVTTKNSRSNVEYKISSGKTPATAIKGFAICHYIQKEFKGNTQLLTATPFTNSPLEIFSMLAMIGYERLRQIGLNNLNTFFDTFVNVSDELVINAALNPERKQVILGFNNLIVLQQLVRQFINHKTGESVNIQRPNKFVLPYTKKRVDGITMNLPKSEQVTTALPMSAIQAIYMEQVKEYAEGKISKEYLEQIAVEASRSSELDLMDEDEDKPTAVGEEMDMDSLDESEKLGVRLLLSLNHARNLALSPYLYKYNTLGKPTAKQYIDTSGKLTYVMECIKSIKAHHEKTNTPMGGIVLYMERGVAYFDLVKEYIVNELGFNDREVGIISAKKKSPLEKGITNEESKEYVKNLFLGKKYNKTTLEEEPIPDEQRIKILIGSATIREGINLQEYSSTLFNLFLSFNPTDIQQLEGRIYRQKNAFANVRIVNPLMIDSADIFMFQKLEEKTSRINSVFETDGVTNVLKTEEFNPKELKYSLVKDPKVLARMEVLEQVETITEEISDLQNEIKKLESVSDYERTINNWKQELDKIILKYRASAIEKPLEAKILAFQNVLKTNIDDNGHYMLDYYSKEEDLPKGKIKSNLSPPNKPYWFDSLVLSFRNLKRIEKDFLVPRGYSTEQVDPLISDIKAEIELKNKQKREIVSDEAVAIRTSLIIMKRQELMIQPKSIKEVVSEFESLNYLLDDVKVRRSNKIISISCPPVDDNGKVRVDGEGLRLLQDCIDSFPNTKFTNGTTFRLEDGTEDFKYSDDRKKIHQSIIEDITDDAVCVEQIEPIAIIMGGAPGSGKSTYLKNNAPYMESDKIWKVDADDIRSRLPEYKGWNSPATHEEAADLVKMLLDRYDTPCKHDLLYDGTMSNAKKYYPIIKRLKKMGYKVFLIFMDIEKSISIERALNRFRDNRGGEQEFGRYVPISVIDSFYESGDNGFQRLKKEVDGFIKVDSLSQKVIESGGIKIPEDRPYFKLTDTDQKAESVTEYLNLEETVDIASTSRNVAKIAFQYASRKMAYLQVNTYLNEVKKHGKTYLNVNGITTAKQLEAHINDIQSKARKGKGAERSKFKAEQSSLKAEQSVLEIEQMALEASKQMDEEIEKSDSETMVLDIKNAIEALHIALEFVSKQEAKTIIEAIESLEISMEFL